MIKDFDTYINEDYFSKLANRKDTGTVRKENEITEDLVRSFERDGYGKHIKSITIRKENGKNVVDIDGNFFLRKDVEQIPFQFGKVSGSFNCFKCQNLTSLEGCPKEVGDIFQCSYCDNLTSIEGCPKEVGGDFICSDCNNLTSLEGCPEKVGGDFYCFNCQNLTSLEGSPKEVGGYFNCSYCKNLKSIEGCPQKVDKDFYCDCCGKKFTREEVKSLCDIKGSILV